MPHVVVDPITRIEGHLRIEAEVDGGRVNEAWSTAPMFRGIEIVLKGRDPRDAWAFTQRICGVCTTVHAIASIRAVENAVGSSPPPNARILRNLVMASQCVQDHVIHFYHLHALDWVDLVSALSADPARASSFAQSISDWPLSSARHFAGVRDRLRALAGSKQLGPFANAYWGHPAYRLPPEVNLVAVSHYLEALDWQREFIRIHAMLGGKNPHLQSFLVGGMSTPVDADRDASLNAGTIAAMRQLVANARAFVSKVYIPDLLAVAAAYKDWAGYGGGVGNYLVYGEYPETENEGAPLFFPGGVIRARNIAKVEPVDLARIGEEIEHSWYTYPAGTRSLHPSKGVTRAAYAGPKPPYQRIDGSPKYSWLKSPRYDGLPMEVGPLARVLVAYASGRELARKAVDGVLHKLGVGPEALFSTLGRTAARGMETMMLADKMGDWVEALADHMSRRDTRICDTSKWDPASWPEQASGAGLHEAPRGALGHWVRIEKGAIANYQCVVPTTWNAGPRDAAGHRGPYEEALIGNPIADPSRPLEILRTIHSFDPCIACGVHVVDAGGRAIGEVTCR